MSTQALPPGGLLTLSPRMSTPVLSPRLTTPVLSHKMSTPALPPGGLLTPVLSPRLSTRLSMRLSMRAHLVSLQMVSLQPPQPTARPSPKSCRQTSLRRLRGNCRKRTVARRALGMNRRTARGEKWRTLSSGRRLACPAGECKDAGSAEVYLLLRAVSWMRFQ